MRKCEIGKREIEGHTCVIFVPIDYHPIAAYERGKNLFICCECNMSYLRQYFEMSNKELEDWLDWYEK